jgi:Flp pilus assembly protein CpaB
MNQQQLKLIVTGAIVTAALLIGYIIYQVVHKQVYSATIVITVAPTDATVTINGQKAHSGSNDVKPGNVTVTAARTGFKSESQASVLVAGTTLTIGLALTSNDASTADWYTTHQKDQQALEKIVGTQYTQKSDAAVAQTPLIKELPFIGAGFRYRIDYGQPLPGTTDQGIYITAPNAEQQQEAVQWIKDAGYDPAKYHIKFITGNVN